MNISKRTVEELMRIDEELMEMKRYPIDYSDIPRSKPGTKGRLVNKAWLDSLPQDVVREMARQRLEQVKAAGYTASAETVS
jgi:hypothetical protein